jgi:hypothetical protein
VSRGYASVSRHGLARRAPSSALSASSMPQGPHRGCLPFEGDRTAATHIRMHCDKFKSVLCELHHEDERLVHIDIDQRAAQCVICFAVCARPITCLLFYVLGNSTSGGCCRNSRYVARFRFILPTCVIQLSAFMSSVLTIRFCSD